ncbi:hypothetical protein M2262_004644 [Pseudomonas sp. BIGb0408]|uniref:Elongation factor Tu n=1 Tax=Phytopseudomonas flavescens TaxID=29435 RepID=A0A7Z0BQT5_9GAMM|nr:hypothetical protein [Pseudomonas sp. BIGb0408]NYH76132.1 hypothetical protein [Pseudomonas flavescens]
MQPVFFADIYLLPADVGGRQWPLVSGEWRTVLSINKEHWSARLTFEGQPAPGETFYAVVQLLLPEQALSYFAVGAEFTVWEGGTKGTGRVVSRAT